MNYQFSQLLFQDLPIKAGRGGGLGGIVSWFIRVVIYDICVTGISDILGIPRMAALFIFLGILLGVSFVGYVIKQKRSPGVEEA